MLRKRRVATSILLMASGIVLSVGSLSIAGPLALADPPTPIAGALTSGDSMLPNHGNGGYDVEHYDIDLTYLPAVAPATGGSIVATTTITAVADVPLASFGLDFKGLTISQVLVDGVPATYSRIQDATADIYKLVVTPASAVADTFTVAVTYSGVPENYSFVGGFTMLEGWVPSIESGLWTESGYVTIPSDGGATGIGQPNGNITWFPSNSTPKDKATYTTRITAPNRYTGVGIGALTGSNPVGPDNTQWVWQESMPATTFLAVASIGEFVEHTGSIALSGRTVPISAYGDPVIESQIPPGPTLALLPQILTWGESLWGTYQPSVAGYIQKPIGVGWALEIMGKPFFSGTISERVLVHEYIHQWAGDSVSVMDWSDLWLAEGFATYAEWQWDEDIHAGDAASDRGKWYWETYGDTATWLWDTAPAAPGSRDDLWGYSSYEGGGIALAALRAGIGDDAFFELAQTWFETYANANASTADFIVMAEEVSDLDLSQWTTDWLYTAGRPAAWPDLTTYPQRPPRTSSPPTTSPTVTSPTVTSSTSTGTAPVTTATATTPPTSTATSSTGGLAPTDITATTGGTSGTGNGPGGTASSSAGALPSVAGTSTTSVNPGRAATTRTPSLLAVTGAMTIGPAAGVGIALIVGGLMLLAASIRRQDSGRLSRT